jgi:hypothetical protein
MPYKVFKIDEKFCVYKHDADGRRLGDSFGCHDTQGQAENQIAAIYANSSEKGGEGSGHWGHLGRPGLVGGSSASEGGGGISTDMAGGYGTRTVSRYDTGSDIPKGDRVAMTHWVGVRGQVAKQVLKRVDNGQDNVIVLHYSPSRLDTQPLRTRGGSGVTIPNPSPPYSVRGIIGFPKKVPDRWQYMVISGVSCRDRGHARIMANAMKREATAQGKKGVRMVVPEDAWSWAESLGMKQGDTPRTKNVFTWTFKGE